MTQQEFIEKVHGTIFNEMTGWGCWYHDPDGSKDYDDTLEGSKQIAAEVYNYLIKLDVLKTTK